MKSLWKGKFKTLEEYYKATYSPEYYAFDEYQLGIDPDETIEDYNDYSEEIQLLEIEKCARSFAYFAHKYAKILNTKLGMVPFIMYNYQKRCFEQFETKRWNLISKFRQGGLTTLAEIYGFWKCRFKLSQQVLFLSKTDREAKNAAEIVNRLQENLPDWLKVNNNDEGKWNEHIKQFKDTNSQMSFFQPEAARGLSSTLLIIDEAAFIPDMEAFWLAVFPTISISGRVVVISTVNGVGNWYYDQYQGAKEGKNHFNIIDLDYWENPFYNDPEWVKTMRMQLKESGFAQEVLRSFLGSGNTYIPSDKIVQLQKQTTEPKQKKMQKYANKGDVKSDAGCEEAWANNGALWIWKTPVEGKEYILSVDAAEGGAGESDNSVVEIIDINTLEQVAEFFSNCVQPYLLAEIASNLGIYYNHGLIIVDSLGPGIAVLSHLEKELYYDNIFAENGKLGLRSKENNRTLFLDNLHNRIMNENLKINSARVVNELTTFKFNAKRGRFEAGSGYHDDTVMALSYALYARDQMIRESPIFSFGNQETKTYNASFEEIRNEILNSSKEEFEDLLIKRNKMNDEDLFAQSLGIKRKSESLLREFGW